MILQLSSGQGPAECELAVGKLAESLTAEIPGIKIISKVPGGRIGCFKSIRLESIQDISFLEGSVQWICQSPFRPNHKRKNWFVDVSVIGQEKKTEFDAGLVRFETFRSPGKGGQNVNKVETGVRAVYQPLNLRVESTEARTQHLNRKIALDRLCELIANMDRQSKTDCERINRLEHYRLERGGAVRVYRGPDFILNI